MKVTGPYGFTIPSEVILWAPGVNDAVALPDFNQLYRSVKFNCTGPGPVSFPTHFLQRLLNCSFTFHCCQKLYQNPFKWNSKEIFCCLSCLLNRK